MQDNPYISILFICCFCWLISVNQATPTSTDANNATDDNVDKIVGGTPASNGEFLGYAIPANSGSLCGAYLIRDNILVSAAHCAGAFAGYNVRIGATQRLGADAKETRLAVQECLHPNYRSSTQENDIMLIKLQTPSSQPFKDYYTVSGQTRIYLRATFSWIDKGFSSFNNF
jgi:secreted trypsin-like serine protease